MPSLWVGIRPTSLETRVLALNGRAETLLRARLAPTPSHPQALPWLLESLALWQGEPARAALAVGARSPASVTNRFLNWLEGEPLAPGPLFSLECVPVLRPPRRDGLQLALFAPAEARR